MWSHYVDRNGHKATEYKTKTDQKNNPHEDPDLGESLRQDQIEFGLWHLLRRTFAAY